MTLKGYIKNLKRFRSTRIAESAYGQRPALTKLILAFVATALIGSDVHAVAQEPPISRTPSVPVLYRTVKIDGLQVFYREAGDPKKPTILMLHGFPSSSSQYRDMIPLLSDRYHVVAPDYPGFGNSAQPDRAVYRYTFEKLYDTVNSFTKALGIERFVLYGQDYGVPIGLRFALHQPDRIVAIIIQNGNAYDEGFTDLWAPIKKLWAKDTSENRKALCTFLTREGSLFEHGDGMPTDRINPDTVELDALVFRRPGNQDIQLDLFADYKNNLTLYPAIQECFRRHQFPMLIIWGKRDPSFKLDGAKAFQKDLPHAELHVIDDAGHFACETHPSEVAGYIREFLPRLLDSRP